MQNFRADASKRLLEKLSFSFVSHASRSAVVGRQLLRPHCQTWRAYTSGGTCHSERRKKVSLVASLATTDTPNPISIAADVSN